MSHPIPPRGRQPRNRLPKEENERIIQEALRRFRAETIPVSQISGGSSGGGGGGSTSTGFATFTPIVISAGETFTVPANTQMLYSVPIEVEGTLVIEGELVHVD